MRNQSLYFHYHQDRGHTTEDCRNLRDHLSQLVKAGKLNRFLHQPTGQFGHSGTEFHRDSTPWPALGTINAIFAKLGNGGGSGTRVMSMGGGYDLKANDQALKRAKVMVNLTLGFFKEDKGGTLQPYDDALMVTIRIGGYDVKRVLVD